MNWEFLAGFWTAWVFFRGLPIITTLILGWMRWGFRPQERAFLCRTCTEHFIWRVPRGHDVVKSDEVFVAKARADHAGHELVRVK